MVCALGLRQGKVKDEYCRGSVHSSAKGTSSTDAREARCCLRSDRGCCDLEDNSLVIGKVAAIVEFLYSSILAGGEGCSAKESS